MSKLFAGKKLVFKTTDEFEVDISKMGRDEKMSQLQTFAQHDHYQVSFKGDFIHMVDTFHVKKGEWENVDITSI